MRIGHNLLRLGASFAERFFGSRAEQFPNGSHLLHRHAHTLG